jgi:hypothetical protein
MKSYEKNYFSQFGEDGVTAEILRRIGAREQTCIEFGAWDGLHLSNTAHLWKALGWQALLIEGHPDRYRELVANTRPFPRVTTLCRMVTPAGPGSLEHLLTESGFPRDIDVLSIDIDGDEIYVLEGLTHIRPRLIVIEFNPTIPAHLEVRQQRGEYFGASALAIAKVARGKGYRLAHATQVNLFFVHETAWERLGIQEPDLQAILPRENLTYLITSYDGRAFLSQTPVYFSPAGNKGFGVRLGGYCLSRSEVPPRHPLLAPEGSVLLPTSVTLR